MRTEFCIALFPARRATAVSHVLDRPVYSGAWLEIPYSLEQGISEQQQENLEKDQGISAAASAGSSAGATSGLAKRAVIKGRFCYH